MFLPRITAYEGLLELDGQYARNYNETNGSGTAVEHSLLTEKMRINAYGYIYHPRFISFFLSGAGGFQQESYTAVRTGDDSPRTTASTKEHEFRIAILPEHPYRLELYTLRRRPFYRKIAADGISPVITEKGALFRLEQRPFLIGADYALSSQTTNTGVVDTRMKRLAVTHFISRFVTSAGVHATDTMAPEVRALREEYFFSNQFTIEKAIQLQSKVNMDRYFQDETVESRDDRQVTWTERLSLNLPWNFEGDLSYDEVRDRLITDSPSFPEPARQLFESRAGTLGLTHRLFYSLRTNYGLTYRELESSRGESSTASNHIGATYQKNLPGGRLLAGVDGGRSLTDNIGAPAVAETFQRSADGTGTYTLSQPNVDTATIVLRVKDPSTGLFRTMQEGPTLHYELVPVGDTVRINILDVPFIDTGAAYDFHVAYSVIPAEYELKLTRFSHNWKLDLLNNRISPYYRYTYSKQELLSGSLPGEPVTSKISFVGVSARQAPYSGFIEYESVRSTKNPTRQINGDLRYVEKVAPNAHLDARLFYRRSMYSQDTFGLSNEGHTVNVIGLDAKLKQRLRQKNLSLTAGASLSYRSSTTDTYRYGLSCGLLWNKGSLTVDAGASLNYSESSSLFADSEQHSVHYYASIKRRLF
ncbi:MAG: hypothetical protein A2X56_05300 [Nitrospirae bacterium GWC2_57_13]|jgi:hypothetical protein|nr:MAG: hypothetical protein A2X56_05300 [Nitrospirae bacterium GWC2_57_13]OGW45971.1 MAG: hypothetical protein A2X57_11985 [Nitrospirae bacterium GWD2_57_8]